MWVVGNKNIIQLLKLLDKLAGACMMKLTGAVLITFSCLFLC
jgi:hypothetical protein